VPESREEVAMEGNNIWKVEKAGLYLFGHVGNTYVNVEITRKSLHWAFMMTIEQAKSLLRVLDIDSEDGVYLHEALKGKFITVVGDDASLYKSSKVVRVGDPYGEEFVDLEKEQ
jgi:hypothetical protein